MLKIIQLSIVVEYILVVLSLDFGSALYAGEVCEVDGISGVCQRDYLCESFKNDLLMNKKPKICSFDGNTSIVCCLETNTSSPINTTKDPPNSLEITTTGQDYGNVSLGKCKDYAGLVYLNYSSPTLLIDVLFEIEDTCAIKEENYNDSSVLAREFPHLASIGYDSGRGQQLWKCSGALISQEYIITAASCGHLPNLGVAKYVRLGSTSVRENFYHEKPLQYINIKDFIKHPKYDESNLIHNIAVIKLEAPAKFNSIVRPACLGASSKLSKEGINIGWGTFVSGYMNNEPLKNLLRVRDTRYCQNLKINQMCIEEIPGDVRQRCLADQGSVLQVYNKDNYCTYDIIGIVSDWKDCKWRKPGIYTNISTYIPWIEKIVWGS